MKTLLICGAVTLFSVLPLASISAQTQSTASNSTTYIETSKFIGKKVKSTQGDEIGTVKDIVLDRSTGCLAYTVVSTGGGGGTRTGGGGKMVAVPWAVYSPSTDLNVLTVTVDRDRIYNAPVFDYARVEEYSRPDYITNVYSYYGVSGGAGVGVGFSGSNTTNTGTTTTTGASTTTGAERASASAPPVGANTSPAPVGTAAGNPRETPTARRHPTASPSTRGEEKATPSTRKSRGERGRSEESSPSGDRDTGSRSEAERPQPQQSHQTESNAGTREPRSDSERSTADQSGSGEKKTGTRHHEKTGRHETSSPPEQPEQQ